MRALPTVHCSSDCQHVTAALEQSRTFLQPVRAVPEITRGDLWDPRPPIVDLAPTFPLPLPDAAGVSAGREWQLT